MNNVLWISSRRSEYESETHRWSASKCHAVKRKESCRASGIQYDNKSDFLALDLLYGQIATGLRVTWYGQPALQVLAAAGPAGKPPPVVPPDIGSIDGSRSNVYNP
jgi:hypothetical protein